MKKLLIIIYILTAVIGTTEARSKKSKKIDPVAQELATWQHQQEFDSLYISALILRQTHHTDTAISVMRQALSLNDSTRTNDVEGLAAAMYWMSNRFREKGDAKKSLGSAMMATTCDSTNYWYGMAEGELLMATRQLELARNRLETVVRNNPKKVDALFILADVYLRMDSIDLCMGIMDRVEELEGVSPQLINSKFTILKEAGRIDQAFEQYRRLIAKYPYNITYRLQYAKVLTQYNRTGEAQLCYEAILETEPDNVEALDYLLQFRTQGITDNDSLLMMANETLKVNPEIPTAYLLRAFYYGVNDNTTQAIAEYRNALKFISPSEAFRISYIWGNIGDLEHQNGNVDEAYECYEKSIKYNPNNYSVLNNYAYFLSIEGRDLTKAESMANKVIMQYPDNPTYLDTYAWILYLQNNYLLASFYQKRAIDNDTEGHCTLYDHYGDILKASGNIDEAREQWKKALECEDITEEEKKNITNKLK